MSKIYEKWEVDFLDSRIRKGKDAGQITYAEAIEFGARRQHLMDRKRMVHKLTVENLTKEELAHQILGREFMAGKAKNAFCDAICGMNREKCQANCYQFKDFVYRIER